jgi:hypothetical protein
LVPFTLSILSAKTGVAPHATSIILARAGIELDDQLRWCETPPAFAGVKPLLLH